MNGVKTGLLTDPQAQNIYPYNHGFAHAIPRTRNALINFSMIIKCYSNQAMVEFLCFTVISKVSVGHNPLCILFSFVVLSLSPVTFMF